MRNNRTHLMVSVLNSFAYVSGITNALDKITKTTAHLWSLNNYYILTFTKALDENSFFLGISFKDKI